MSLICWLKSSRSSSCCYPVISLFSFPPWVHTQGSKVSTTFRETSRLLTLWLESGFSVMMRTDLFSFLQAFTVSKYPRLHPTRHIRRLDVEAPASGLPIVFMSMHMSSLCMTPISILMQACCHPIPMFFFPLSTIPIVHLSIPLSRSSYLFPHSSLQESSILHHTHFPLIHSPSHSLVYMESHGCGGGCLIPASLSEEMGMTT